MEMPADMFCKCQGCPWKKGPIKLNKIPVQLKDYSPNQIATYMLRQLAVYTLTLKVRPSLFRQNYRYCHNSDNVLDTLHAYATWKDIDSLTMTLNSLRS